MAFLDPFPYEASVHIQEQWDGENCMDPGVCNKSYPARLINIKNWMQKLKNMISYRKHDATWKYYKNVHSLNVLVINLESMLDIFPNVGCTVKEENVTGKKN